MDTQAQSHLFTLPAELRTAIYEYVYPANQRGYTTDLANIDSPPQDLLLTCKLIQYEAYALYKQSFRNFWSQRKFILDRRKLSIAEAAKILRSIREEDFHQITSITVHARSPSGNFVCTLVDYRGGWRVVRIGYSEATFLRYRPWLTRQSPSEDSVVDPTRAAYDSYRNEEELRDACEKYSRNPPPLKIQVKELLGIPSSCTVSFGY